MALRSYPSELRDNFRALYYDVFWFGMLAGSSMAFVSIYATRLGASSFQISLLIAGPAIGNLLFSLPLGRWLAGRSLAPATFWSAVFHRAGYMVLVPLPWLMGAQFQVWTIVLVTLVMSLPGALLSIGFNSLFAEIVPPIWRAEVVGKRNAVVAVSMTTTTLLSGQILNRMIYPLNYAAVFAIGVLGAALSTYYVGKLHLPDHPPAWQERFISTKETIAPRARLLLAFNRSGERMRLSDLDDGKERQSGQEQHSSKLLNLDLLRTPFGLMMAAYLMLYTSQYLGIPIFPLVQVRVLDLSDEIISLGNGLFYAVMFLVSLRMLEISARLGHRGLLIAGALSMAAYPFILRIAVGPGLFWVASIMGGAAWALTNAGLNNRLMERAPEGQRPAAMAIHNVVLNIGILVGSLCAPLIAEWLSLQPALFLVAMLRFLAGLLFIKWG